VIDTIVSVVRCATLKRDEHRQSRPVAVR